MNSLQKTLATSLAVFLFVACSSSTKITSVEHSTIQLNSSAKSDPEFEKVIAPYKSSMEKEMNQVLIVSESSAEKDLPEGKLGNITCDMVLKKANEYTSEQKLEAVDIYLTKFRLWEARPADLHCSTDKYPRLLIFVLKYTHLIFSTPYHK